MRIFKAYILLSPVFTLVLIFEIKMNTNVHYF